MLVRGDLGFSRLVLVVVVLIFPVIGFVLRRKWRFAAARREEIRRLLVLASEESARAELEATVEYGAAAAVSVSQQLHYQCAVCFCPTTKLCARCKAVRYCSGKCQIIHWRQGHKEECRPFTIGQSNEGGGSSQKVFIQEGHVSSGDSYESEGRQCAKRVETFDEEFSNPGDPEVLPRKDNSESEESNSTIRFTFHTYEEFSESTTCSEASVDASLSNSNDSDGLDGLQSTGLCSDKFETKHATMDRTRSPFSDQSPLENSSGNSDKFGQSKPGCSDGDAPCGSSISSGWSVDGSNDSLSEPSTPSSGFWEGTINFGRSRINAPDDCAQSSSSESGGDFMSGPKSSLGFSFDLAKDIVPPIAQRGYNTKTVISDDDQTSPAIKKHIDEATLSEELCKADLKSRDSPSLSLETSKSTHVDTCSNSTVLRSREIKPASSSAYCARPDASCEVHLITKDTKMVSSSPSLSSKGSKGVATDTISSSYALRSQEVGSLLCKGSDASLTSSTRRDSDQTAKSSKVDAGIHGDTTCSSQFPNYSQNGRNGLKTTMLKVVDQIKDSKLSKHYPSGAGNETAGRYSVKGLFPYELFVKLYNWNKVEMHPCGLVNCGNSCYANAVLQCLAFTPPLTAYILQRLHSKACENKEWCFTCEFESLILKAKEGSGPLSPIRILSHIENIGSHLGYGREEDAHEFLRYAIDTMQSICLKEAGARTSGTLNEETTLIGLTFGGYLRSKIKCMKCGGKSERHERMMDLTVEINGNICTLDEALRQFTGTEILDGENKYQCSRCKSYEKAKKKLTIVEAPNVLTIALKRFQSGKFGKLSKSIQFPEILDMAPYMSGTSDMSPIYRLYGVVVHLDIMNASFSGHYVCYVKNIQNKWFKIDDSSVNPVELERVLTKGAYMLLYARCSPRAPKLLRNSIVPRDPRKTKNPSVRSRSHSTVPSYSPRADCLNYQTTSEGFYSDHPSFQRRNPILEEDSASDNSSSFFSEAGSCSTESSNRDSTSADDYFDQIFNDLGHNWNKSWRNSSDSDTSSSSSSPSPLYCRRSPLASSDHYASKYPETSCSRVDHAESAEPSRSSKVESSEGKESVPILCSDASKHCRKLDSSSSRSSISSSSSCRETNSDRLGRLNPFNSVKSSSSPRRSIRGRTD